jgi:hypothetical protein
LKRIIIERDDDLFQRVERKVITDKNITTTFREVLSMKPETAGKLKYGGWGLICGAVISMIIGFGWGGWSTAGKTEAMATEAVLASQAAICVAQFMKQPNHQEKLKEFEKASSWERDKFIEKGGWDKMPGQEKADYNVSQACADGLRLLL